MLRRNSNFGSRRLRGIIYIVAQFLGGILAATVSIFLLNENKGDIPDINCHQITVSPVIVEKDGPKNKWLASCFSEVMGTFLFVFMIMICTDKKTQFSDDKVINCFIMAASYVSSRLFAGGPLVTVRYSCFNTSDTDKRGYLTSVSHKLGPLLNPALAFG